ncbi:MAG: type IV secretory system conjugative DNA transfer family protein, partial [Oscillospiraceae bacterium]|nr:type IV secretory system conjugative DNA transfer family protein [Oscillospiraceae bacterium]
MKHTKKLRKLAAQFKAAWKLYSVVVLAALYFYGMLLNSFMLATENFKFNAGKSVWVANPIKNIFAIFTPTGIGVTFFLALMYLLITKKGYSLLSGVKIRRDERGFNVIDEGSHGTSGWMGEKEIPLVLDAGKADELHNAILGKLSDDEYLALRDGNGFNRHILVYGATGAGKSRGFVKPFILQSAKLRQSMILVDPKAEFFESMSGYLEDMGYTVKAFNLLDMGNSDAWNCLNETSFDPNMVQTVAEVIMRNTSNPNESARQDFWQLAEINLLMALMHYVQRLTYEGTDELLPAHERSLGTIYKILSTESIQSLDNKIKDLPKDHAARAPYGIFRQAAHQLWGNIAIGLGSRLNVFQNQLVDKITKYNDIDLELPGKQPCAYFCIISDQDSSLEFLSSLFFSLLFRKLSDYARTHGVDGRLPVEVNFLLDEFCNIGKI